MYISLPNLLTYGRILIVPAVVFTFFFDGHAANWWALGLYTAACITDFFDGYLARLMNLQSSLGRMLDPIADKLLIGICLMMLVSNQTINNISIVAAVIILSREILVSGLREFLAEIKVSVPVSNLAKWKTGVQMVSLGFLLAGDAGKEVLPYSIEIGLTLLWIAALLTVYTGYDYCKHSVLHSIKQDTE